MQSQRSIDQSGGESQLTLSRWLRQVNSGFVQALAVAALTALFVFLIWRNGPSAAGDESTLGPQLAAVAAAASVDGLMEQDYIELGVIANRMAAVDGVGGVAMYRLDGSLLAVAGETGPGVPFTQEIVFDGQLMGFARVTLDAPATAVDWNRVALTVASVVGLPLLVAWASHIPAIRGRRKERATRKAAHYLLAATLRSGLPPDSEIQHRALSQGLRLAKQVGTLYRAECRLLPGEGLLMAFKPGAAGPDRAFRALCAAFLLADSLIRLPEPSDWTVGVQSTAFEETNIAKSASVDDAALLASLAGPGIIAVSDAFLADVRDPSRIRAEPLAHPMLRKLLAEDKTCHVVTGLAPAIKVLVDHQVDRLVELAARAT